MLCDGQELGKLADVHLHVELAEDELFEGLAVLLENAVRDLLVEAELRLISSP